MLYLCTCCLLITLSNQSKMWLPNNHNSERIALGKYELKTIFLLFRYLRTNLMIIVKETVNCDYLWRASFHSNSNLLHLHEIVEGLYFHCSLSVCLCVCVCVCVQNSCEQNSSRTDAPIWTRFSLSGCLQHLLEPYWNWWPWVKGQGHGDRKCM